MSDTVQQGKKKKNTEQTNNTAGVPPRRVVIGMRVLYQTNEENPVAGTWAEVPRLLGGLYRVCWLWVSEDSSDGVGVRLPLGLNRVPWPCGCGEGLLWGSRGGNGGSGGGWGRDSCSATESGWA